MLTSIQRDVVGWDFRTRRCLQVRAEAATQSTRQQYSRRTSGRFKTPAEQIDQTLFTQDALNPIGLDANYVGTKKDVRRLRTQRLQELYGEHVTDGDVRLYLTKRERNRQRPQKRGDFPADDSFDRPQTFLKLSPAFREVVLTERAEALSAMMTIAPDLARQLYQQLPGLLCFTTLEVSYRVKGLCRSLHMPAQQLLPLLAADPRVAFLDPEVVEARCAQVAKLCRLRLAEAAHLMAAHGDVLLARSSRLLRRVEEVAVTFRCSTAAALHLLCACPLAATLERATLRQRVLAAAQLLELLDQGGSSGADTAAASQEQQGADSGPVVSLFPGAGRRQLQQLWALLSAWPQLALLDPAEQRQQLQALQEALQLPRQELLQACRQQPWLLAADADGLASRLQLLLHGVPHLLPAARQGSRGRAAAAESTEAKKAKLLVMLQAGAAADSLEAAKHTAVASSPPTEAAAAAAAAAGEEAAGSTLAAAEPGQVVAAVQVLGSCRQLLEVEVSELQQVLVCLVSAVSAAVRRPAAAVHQQVVGEVHRQPQLLLLQVQVQGGDGGGARLVLRSQVRGSVEGSGGGDGSGAGGVVDDVEQWRDALKAVCRARRVTAKQLLSELHQLPSWLAG